MDHVQIEKFLGRARSVAIKWGYPQHADDFAQEAFIAISSGSHPKLEWLFIEFLRRQHGSSRTISGRLRQRAEKYATRLDAPVSEDGNYGLNHDVVECSDSNPETELANRRTPINYGILTGRKRDIAVMYFEDELTAGKIGEIFGITESRVSQLMTEIKKHIKTFTEYHELREQTELDSDLMRIRLK